MKAFSNDKKIRWECRLYKDISSCTIDLLDIWLPDWDKFSTLAFKEARKFTEDEKKILNLLYVDCRSIQYAMKELGKTEDEIKELRTSILRKYSHKTVVNKILKLINGDADITNGYSKRDFKIGDKVNFLAKTPCGSQVYVEGEVIEVLDDYVRLDYVSLDGIYQQGSQHRLYYEVIVKKVK